MQDSWLWLVTAVAVGAIAGILVDRWFETRGK